MLVATRQNKESINEVRGNRMVRSNVYLSGLGCYVMVAGSSTVPVIFDLLIVTKRNIYITYH